MPFKANAARRHRIPKQRYRVTSWAQYDASLRQRGSLTVWFTGEAIATWRAGPRTTRGGQAHYSALAIRTALTLRAVSRLALCQTEGLIGSILQLLGLDLAVPDHSTLSRRAEPLEVPRPCSSSRGPVHLLVDSTGLRLGGPGEWLIEKHGNRRRRPWRKLHIGACSPPTSIRLMPRSQPACMFVLTREHEVLWGTQSCIRFRSLPSQHVYLPIKKSSP